MNRLFPFTVGYFSKYTVNRRLTETNLNHGIEISDDKRNWLFLFFFANA